MSAPEMQAGTMYTKGPWRAGRSDMFTVIEGHKGKYVYAGAEGEPTAYVAAAVGFEIDDFEEIYANALLIAAAPDLLEALQATRAYVENKPVPFADHECRWCGACVDQMTRMQKAAIAKALGGSHA